jgi:hypothetical protein
MLVKYGESYLGYFKYFARITIKKRTAKLPYAVISKFEAGFYRK